MNTEHAAIVAAVNDVARTLQSLPSNQARFRVLAAVAMIFRLDDEAAAAAAVVASEQPRTALVSLPATEIAS